MKLLICGSRTFYDYKILKREVLKFIKEQNIIITDVISGCANGADILGEQFAADQKYNILRFPANWNKYGKSAGHIRNKQMVQIADYVICFWNKTSSGTKDTIDLCEKYDKIYKVVEF